MKKIFNTCGKLFFFTVIISLYFNAPLFSIYDPKNFNNKYDACDVSSSCASLNSTCSAISAISKSITPHTLFKFFPQGARLYTQYHKIKTFNEDALHNILIESSFSYDTLFACESVMPLYFGSNTIGVQGSMDFHGDGLRDTNNLVAGYFGFNDDADFSFGISESLYKNSICDTKLTMQSHSWWVQINVPFVKNTQCITRNNCLPFEGTLGVSSPDVASSGVLQTPNALDGSEVFNKLDLDGTFSPFPTSTTGSKDLYDYLNTIANLDNDINSDNSESLANDTLPLNFWGTTHFSVTKTDPTTDLVIKQSVIPDNTYQFVFNDPFINENFTIAIDQIKGAQTIEQGFGGYTFGDLKERLYNKIIFDPCDTKTSTLGVADIHIQFGKDLFCHNYYGMSIFGKFVLPTGTKIDRTWYAHLFSPLIGNGRHYEAGGGFTAYVRGEKDYNALQLDISGYATHQFSNQQFRSFDYDDAPLSRWALVKELQKASNYNADNDDDQYSYAHKMKALGDLNAYDCSISCDMLAEFVCDLTFTRNAFSLGVGYSLGYRSQEKIECINDPNAKQNVYLYGYKGSTCNDAIRFVMTSDTADFVPDENQIINYLQNGDQVGSGPEGSDIQIKTLSNIVKGGKSGAFSYGTEFSSTTDPITNNDLLEFPSINCSGIAPAITIHRLFMHSDYCATEISNQPFIGINGAIILHDMCKMTLTSWEIGMRMGIMF